MPIELKIPVVGESISEVEIGDWRKAEGDPVKKDEVIATLESEKATVEMPAPADGVLGKILKAKGQTATVGEVIGYLNDSGKLTEKTPPRPVEKKDGAITEAPTRVMPAAQRALAEQGLSAADVKASGPGGRLLKKDVLRQAVEVPKTPAASAPSSSAATPQAKAGPAEVPQTAAAAKKEGGSREEEVVSMSRLRRTLAERLVEAQHNAALLTTFNEIDMSAIMAQRKEYGEIFQQKHGVKLGFMSFFVKAAVDALKLVPQVNAEIRGTNIVYKNY